MPMIWSKVDSKGIEWQVWRSKRADDPCGPIYVVQKYPSGEETLRGWGFSSLRSLRHIGIEFKFVRRADRKRAKTS